METVKDTYRKLRVIAKQRLGLEPIVKCEQQRMLLETHGSDYCRWKIPVGQLSPSSIVIDVGLGEDISFSTSLIQKYGCTVHGFDPTPRSVAYVRSVNPSRFVLHQLALGAESKTATLFLPNDPKHVSGSLTQVAHVGRAATEVNVVTLGEALKTAGASQIDLLKVDIEGAEYELIDSADFRTFAPRIGIFCVEFHHRWKNFGPRATLASVASLRGMGFCCVWRSTSTNEEFTFTKALTKARHC